MTASASVRLGVAGIGGYARIIADLILEEGPGVYPPAALVATCDPALVVNADRVADLRRRGVAVDDDYQQLLDRGDIDAVWLPVPIHIHRPFAQRALEAGKAVMVEKPVAGTVEEVDALIGVRDRVGLPVAVGFQDIYDPSTMALKRLLLGGGIGQVQQATLWASWPRSDRYFRRTEWAGRLRMGDTWILDSPANNAMAHFVNLALFLLGAHEASSAEPVWVEAELYRAALIENYDTLSARVRFRAGPELLILMSHAAAEECPPQIRIVGDRGHVEWTRDAVTITANGTCRTHVRDNPRRAMLGRFAKLVCGLDDPDCAVATLEVARTHSLIISAISEATPVVQAPESAITNHPVADGSVRVLVGVENAIRHCAQTNKMLHESGQLPFTQPSGAIDVTNYRRFSGPKQDRSRHAAAGHVLRVPHQLVG